MAFAVGSVCFPELVVSEGSESDSVPTWDSRCTFACRVRGWFEEVAELQAQPVSVFPGRAAEQYLRLESSAFGSGTNNSVDAPETSATLFSKMLVDESSLFLMRYFTEI